MSQQILIIGLGQFGMSLAKTLTEKGAEVLAVDSRKDLVDEASIFVTEAVVMNATDENELARLQPEKRNCSVCAIGDESREASIICVALLRQMGAPLIIARANDTVHRRILQLVGAHQIVNPEMEFGRRFAQRLMYSHVVADTSISDDLSLTEINVQPDMIGKNLIELALPRKYGVMVAAVRRGDSGKIVQPSPSEPLMEKDNLIIIASEAALSRMLKKV